MTMQRNRPTPGPSVVASDQFSPTWREADEWRVRHQILVPSEAMSKDAVSSLEDFFWVYRVKSVGADGAFNVTATAEAEDAREWRLTFGAGGGLVELREPDGTHTKLSGDLPLVPLRLGSTWDLSPAWPAFPLVEGESSFQDGTLTQSVVLEGTTRVVTLVHRGRDAGVDRIVTLEQRWEVGRPFWSSYEIVTRATWRGETWEMVEAKGQVLGWPPDDAAGALP